MVLLLIIPDESLNQEEPTPLDPKDFVIKKKSPEPFLNLSVISSKFVKRSLGSTLDLTAIALVKCQHAEVVVSLSKNLSQIIIDNTSYALAA